MLAGISRDEIIVSWLTRRDHRVMVIVDGIKSESERMGDGKQVLRAGMLDGHKGGGPEYLAEVRRERRTSITSM